MNKLVIIALAVAVAGRAMPVFAGEIPESTPYIENIEPDSVSEDVSSAPDLLPSDENSVQDFPVPDVGSESESIGEFGIDDTTVQDAFNDLVDDVGGSGFDFISPSPSPEGEVSLPDVSPTPDSSFFFEDDDSGGLSPFASYSTYYGSISTTYLEFMRGFLPKLKFKEHYVASRTSQYDYIFAYGENLTFSGGIFSGSGITVITWNTYNYGSYSSSYQSTFSLNPGSYLVYSDLSDVYPSLADTAGFTLRQILILLVMFFLGVIIDHMYQVRKIRRVKGL